MTTSTNDRVQFLEAGIKEKTAKLFYEIDWAFIEQMAQRMQVNKHKYRPFNWHKPIDKEELKQAITRHFIAIMKGDLEDDGRPFGHLEALACNAMMLNYQLTNFIPTTIPNIPQSSEQSSNYS